ncbi:MAG: NUDIX hydrolase [Phycicoccus sp.]|nr:NUDIX hydrolase [Phycicoccus sp.]NMM33415.1 NUDIX hydrolase [Phycicoccus sp.]
MIQAAGALPWRHRRGRLEVVMVHRPRYDDWSWAKGKLDPGEEWPVAAAREVFEETGLHVRLGRPLPTSRYDVVEGGRADDSADDSAVDSADDSADDSGQPAPKEVRYWAAEVVGGDGALVNEIDEVAWLDVDDATTRLTYDRDRDQLQALVQADRDGTLTTWPLVILRHAHAFARSTWTQADPLRPLDARGRERAEALVPLLTSYGVIRVVTSPAARCLDSVLPYAAAAGLKIRLKPGLSEESFERRPDHAPGHLTKLLARGSAAVVSTHGPVLPRLLEQLAGIADASASGASGADSAEGTLLDAVERGMGKGEALVAHVVGSGDKARVVDVELYPAP